MVPEVTRFPSWGSTRSNPTFGSELYLITKQHISRHQRAGAALARGRASPDSSGDGHISVKSPRLTEELDLPHHRWIHACTVGKFLSVGDFWFDFVSAVGPQASCLKDQHFPVVLPLAANPETVPSKVAMNLTPLSTIFVKSLLFAYVTDKQLSS